MKCFFFKLWISHTLDGVAPVKGVLKNHLLRCPSCRRFYRTGLSLNSRLQAQACMEGWPSETPLLQRVMATIRRRGRAPRPARRAAVAAACLTLLAAGALIFLHPPLEQTGTGDLHFMETVRLDRYLPEPRHMNVTEPLSVEMDRLSSDVESMMEFLGTMMSTVLVHHDSDLNRKGF